MFLLFPIFMLGGSVTLAAFYRRQFSKESEEFTRQWFFRWLRRGVVIPILVWIVMNAGRMPFMPPLTRHIAKLKAAGNFYESFLSQISLATMVIVSGWLALTFIWFMTGLFRRARNHDDLILAILVWSPVTIPLFGLFCYLFGWAGCGFATVLWIWPLTQYCLNVAETKPLRSPTYSRAIGKIKFGKYSEAEMAIISELERSESDFDGWLMLAELYANQYHDVAEAEKTIHELCGEPTTTLSQISIALHRLADWHLRLRQDPAAARRALEEICTRMPGTHLALMARNRINQLPESRAELHEQSKPRPVPLAKMDAPGPEPAPPMTRQEALKAANQWVETLKADPNDVSAREKLAQIFAEQLGQLDLAVEQLELLTEMPGQPANKMAEWLGLMAAWIVKQRGEGEAARKILERLVHDFPQSPQAFSAQRQLILMQRSAKLRKVS